MIGGSEERKEEVMADEDRCTLGGSNTFIDEAEECINSKEKAEVDWRAEETQTYEDLGWTDRRKEWHAAKLSLFPELLGHYL